MTELDLVFPIPENGRSATQRWFVEHHTTYYLPGEWGITGECWIFGGGVHHNLKCELRFGRHGYMRGFKKLCLAVRFADDDKYEFEKVSAAFMSGTLSGEIAGRSVVFKPYPFQVTRLKNLLQTVEGIHDLEAMIGCYMMECSCIVKKMKKID